jgi:hypothetical protein
LFSKPLQYYYGKVHKKINEKAINEAKCSMRGGFFFYFTVIARLHSIRAVSFKDSLHAVQQEKTQQASKLASHCRFVELNLKSML